MSIVELSRSDRAAPALAVPGGGRLLIDGDWHQSKSGETIDSIDPSTEQVVAHFAAGATADVDLAVAAARRALESGPWPALDPHERARFLFRIADMIEMRLEAIARVESIDVGMPIATARRFVASAARVFRYYAGWCTKIHGATNPSAPDIVNFSLREPVGVCALIVPWNTPFSMAAWKIAPALACGNTAILKPAEQTALSALMLGEIALAADLPPGVLNIVTGFGTAAGAALVDHAGVDKVAFTGSTAVGSRILQASAHNLKRVTLELGGKSPNVVFDDADLEAAVATTVRGFCQMTGQMCVASSRIFVQRGIYDAFVERLSAQAEAVRVGDPLSGDTEMGPLVSKAQFDRVTSYYDIGVGEGASMRTGGHRPSGIGYFVAPTVFEGVHNDMRIAREEIFGPVTAVMPFDTEDEAIRLGNDTEYGLAAAVWTRDVSQAHRMARALKAGTIWVNTCLLGDPSSPFGGFKQSGIGREMGSASLESYTELKSVYLKL